MAMRTGVDAEGLPVLLSERLVGEALVDERFVHGVQIPGRAVRARGGGGICSNGNRNGPKTFKNQINSGNNQNANLLRKIKYIHKIIMVAKNDLNV